MSSVIYPSDSKKHMKLNHDGWWALSGKSWQGLGGSPYKSSVKDAVIIATGNIFEGVVAE